MQAPLALLPIVIIEHTMIRITYVTGSNLIFHRLPIGPGCGAGPVKRPELVRMFVTKLGSIRQLLGILE